ncbi:MAG: hypothetical protein ACRDGL_04650, partial [Candidatus Limnocylindrales bacterium]
MTEGRAGSFDAGGLAGAGTGPGGGGGRLVAVAVDAPGTSGGRLYDYFVPEGLADLGPGEAVIVPFGRRQAIGVVLGPGAGPPGPRAIKSLVDRVRTDGPILPPLGVRLARLVAETYLAPTATVVRQMLPPGFLERLELYVAAVPGVAPAGLDG